MTSNQKMPATLDDDLILEGADAIISAADTWEGFFSIIHAASSITAVLALNDRRPEERLEYLLERYCADVRARFALGPYNAAHRTEAVQ